VLEIKSAMDGKNTMDSVVKVLEEADTEYIFGVPGGYMMKLYDAMIGSSIKPILVRHEQIASIMAEVYGRLTGKAGVFTAQGAWTVTNGLMGPLEAIQGSSPMLILTDMTDNAPYSHHGSYQVGTGEYGGYDVKKALEATTKYVSVVHEPNQAVQTVQLALKHATSGNKGPTSVVFHSAAINGMVDTKNGPIIYHTKRYLVNQLQMPCKDSISKVIHMLQEAEKPFIIAGNGVKIAHAYEELEEFAEIIGAPVGTTAQGKSAIRENHPNAVGVIGNWGQKVANKKLAEADVILVVGSRLAPTDTCNHHEELINPIKQKLIQVDIEARHASWTFPIEQPIIGDAKLVLQQLIKDAKETNQLQAEEIKNRVDKLQVLKNTMGYMSSEEMFSNDIPLKPQKVLKVLNDIIDENTMITLDAGENRVFTINGFKTKSPGSLILPGSAGGMGYAIPSAMAAKLVYPEKKVIAIAGDGGFAMTMNGLISAVELNLPIIVVILNNAALGWVKNAQGETKIASEFEDIQFADIATSMGCEGYIVREGAELKNIFEKALKVERPVVIDVKTTDDESYKKVMSSLATSLED